MTIIEHALQEKFLQLHPAESANILEKMHIEKATSIISAHTPLIITPIFEKISPDIALLIAQHLPEDYVAKVLEHLSTYYAVGLLARFSNIKREAILDLLPDKYKKFLLKALSYPENSAGALMEPDFITMHSDITVQDAVARLHHIEQYKIARVIYIVDDEFHLKNKIELQTLLLAPKDAKLNELTSPITAYVQLTDEREQVVNV
ncbi:MAG: hypothetical protein ABSF18_01835, partial [Gammaproteobacteria bacterium]